MLKAPDVCCIGGFFVLYLEAVFYSVNPCILRVVKVWCRVSRRQTLHFIWCKTLVSRFAISRSALHGNLLTMVQKYNKSSEPPNFTLQSYVKPILTFRLP